MKGNLNMRGYLISRFPVEYSPTYTVDEAILGAKQLGSHKIQLGIYQLKIMSSMQWMIYQPKSMLTILWVTNQPESML